jgi:hypothetical protein
MWQSLQAPGGCEARVCGLSACAGLTHHVRRSAHARTVENGVGAHRNRRMETIRAMLGSIGLALLVALLPAACASSRPEVAAQAPREAEMAEARLGAHRFRLPVDVFRYGLAPQGDRRFELALHLPDYAPLAVEPAPGSVEQAMSLAVEVVHIDDIPAGHMLSFWLGESPPDASPDPASGEVPRTAGAPVHGLRTYFLAADAPARGDPRDRYVGEAANRPAPSFIQCTRRSRADGVILIDGRPLRSGDVDAIAICDHAFLLDADIAVYMRYARVHLPQWRQIESRIADRLRQAMAAPDASR